MKLQTVLGDLGGFLQVPFNKYLVILLLILGAAIFITEQQSSGAVSNDQNASLTIHFFYSPTCQHCAAQEPFNEKLVGEFKSIRIIRHDITIPAESRLLLIMSQAEGIPPSNLGTPVTMVNHSVFIGFDSEETTGKEIRAAVAGCLANSCPTTSSGSPGNRFGYCAECTATNAPSKESLTKSFDLPIFGKTDLSSLSLPVLAVVLGLVDGFNPCAMWVLVYLIGMVMNLGDKRRLWLIVGTFLLASGVLYFLFMTAWLNAFLFLGYIRPVTLVIGLVALGAGILSIKEYLETRGEPVLACKVTDADDKQKLANQIKEVISAPLTLATLAGIVFLAFTINSIEFLCSAAIPAVFTQVLALSNLSTWQYYGYILLYDFFFMLDDLLVFGSAILIMQNVGEGYARYCKIIGGAVMLLLGLMLLFAPNMLA